MIRSSATVIGLTMLLACGSPGASSSPTGSPSIAPPTPNSDEAMLAFEWYSGRDYKDVVVMRQDGTHRRALATGIEPDEAHAVVDWSPDGQTIAFVVGEWYEGTSIWTVGADGQGAIELIGSSDECRLGVNFPAYSPDGKRLLYVCQDGLSGADPDLVGILKVLDLVSGQTTEVTTVHLPDEPLFPRWSRDGRTAVVQLNQWDAEPEEDVWLGSQVATVPIEGGDFTRLTPADAWAADPDWSRVADVIVYGTYDIRVREMNVSSTIYTMLPDGSNKTVIAESPTDGLERYTGPRWTPDGRRLLISIAKGDGPGTQINDVGLAFLDLDGTVTRIPVGAGVGARLQPMPSQ